MEDPTPGPSAVGSAEPKPCLWDMFDGLIDRMLREDALLPSQRTNSQTEAFGKGSSRSLPSSHRDEVSRHHQRVSERIRLSKQTYPTHSPYVRRHKIISQLMDINEPSRPIVKHSSRRLRKLRAKPLLEISDWGLSDDSFSDDDAQDDHGSEIIDSVSDIEPKENRNNETTSEIKTVHSAFCNPRTMVNTQTDTPVSVQGHCQNSKATEELASLPSFSELDTQHSLTDSIAQKESLSLGEFIRNGSLVQEKEIDPRFDKTCKLRATLASQTLLNSQYGSRKNINRSTSNVQSELNETRQSPVKPTCMTVSSIDDALRRTTGLEDAYESFMEKERTENSMKFEDGYRFAKETKDTVCTKSKMERLTSPHEAMNQLTDVNSDTPSNIASPQKSFERDHRDYPETNLQSNVPLHYDHVEFPTCSTQSFEMLHTKSAISEHSPSCDNLSPIDNNLKCTTDHPVLEHKDGSQGLHEKKDIVNIGDIDDAEIESILATLLRAQKNFKNVVPSINPEEYQRKLASYMERKKEHNPEGNVSEDDARRVVLLEHIIRFFECKIVEIVKFAKCVPGFKDLCMDDQAALIKVSRTECGMVGGVPMVNTRDKVVHAENNYTLPLQLLGTVVSPRFFEEFFKLCKKIEAANIKEEEGALLRGITITFTDRCKLKESEKVQTIQNKLVTCLMHVIKRETTTVSPQVRLGQLFEILTCVRNYTDVDSNLLRDTLVEYPNYSGNDLVKEFLDRSQIV